jgi:FdhD protein
MWKRGLRLTKWTENTRKNQNDFLVIEKNIKLVINHDLEIELFITPSLEEEIILGYLLCNSFINHESEIITIEKKESNIYEIELNKNELVEKTNQEQKPFKLSNLEIFHIMAFFQEKSILFKDTAITQSAAIANKKEILFFAEDISRFNAIYKVVGQAKSANLADKTLITSSKLDLRTVKIAALLNLPIIISRTAPTDKAFDYAINKNITIIGFARGKRFNLYTCPDKIYDVL